MGLPGGTSAEWLTTTTILQRLRDYENRDAWERLAGRFRPPIVAFARRLGVSPADAEDVAQNTLLAFAEGFRRGGYDAEKGRLSRWLFGIAYRQALGQRRATARIGVLDHPSAIADWPDEASATGAWDEEWERSLLERCLVAARTEVEPTTYRAFELVVLDERSPADAARLLGVPIKTVYNAKHRLLARIRELRSDLDEYRPDA